jgi:hypothetical protein
MAGGITAAVMVLAHPYDSPKRTVASTRTATQGASTAGSLTSPPDASSSAPEPSPSAASSSPTPAPTGSSSPAGTPTQAPAPSRRQAAVALAGLLARSVSDRQAVIAAYNDASQCGTSLPQDAQTFLAAAASHRRLLDELTGMPGTPVLPQPMTRALSSAWQASANADDDFARWARDQAANGCSTVNSDPNLTAAGGPNRQATTSKTAFAQLWNPLAQAYGLTTYSQSDL